ncbi:MAG TPA: multiheme c-type cytochrome [Planctomycetota bacterium]|nr:multiheme c-type cytochrome [Planctomycetota bacterium]
MSLGARIAGLAFLAAGAGFVAWGLLGGESGAPGEAILASSAQCRSCHPAVYEEWQGSWHGKAFVDPEVRALSNDYRNEQCIDCHAPRPAFETGVGKPPLPRSSRRAEGVDCAACHHLPGGGVAAVSKEAAGACGPRHEPLLPSPEFCGGCHDQHHTVKEWRATPFPAEGISCVTCHMEPVDRGGRPGADHRSPASHDPDRIRKAVTVAVRREGALLRIAVKNTGAGHHFPTDERSRAADLIARVLGPDGAVRSVRRLDRYRNPYRDQVGASAGLPYREESPLLETRPESTLLPYGVERSYEFPVPEGSGTIEILLTYKTIPYPEDPEAILADEKSFAEKKAFLVHREAVPF